MSSKTNEITSDFDEIVKEELRKSVVVAPSDPNGGAKLPLRQKNKAKEKGRGKEQYMAIFDREAQESNEQLDEWMEHTNKVTGSPEKFVNDDDDKEWSEDPDNDVEDSRGAKVYDPYSDDDEDEEDEDVINVKAHTRRKKKVSKAFDGGEDAEADDHTEEFAALSDEDDDDLDEGYGVHQHHGRDHIHHKNGDHEHHDKKHFHVDEDGKIERMKKEGREEKHSKKDVRKAFGADVAAFADASPLAKALIDYTMDLADEVRELRAEIAKAFRLVRSENRQMTKSLASGMAQLRSMEVYQEAPQPVQYQDQPIRKGYGLPVQTTQKFQRGFDLAKAMDVLDKGLREGEVPLEDTTNFETNMSPHLLSRAGQEYLRRNGITW